MAVQALTKAPTILLTNLHIGEQLFQSQPREVRRILVWDYEVRYEIQDSDHLRALAVAHARELVTRKKNMLEYKASAAHRTCTLTAGVGTSSSFPPNKG